MNATRTSRKLSAAAQSVIADVYLVGSVPADPHGVLLDISRSVSIIGRLLNGLADRYAVAGKNLAGMITIAGSVLWGIVEISVPESALFYLSRNWIKLVAFLGVLIVVLGVLTNTKGMPAVGVDLVVGVYLTCVLSRIFHRFMNTGSVVVKRLKWALLLPLALLAIVGSLYLLVAHAQDIAYTLQWVASGFAWIAKHVPFFLSPKP
jgi:hypothetical protein